MISWFNRYTKYIGILCVGLSVVLAIVWSYDHSRLKITDPWSYEVGARNFAQAQFILDTE